jgi:hypothetical protein
MLTASDLADVLSLQIALGDRPNLYRSISIRRRGGVSLYIHYGMVPQAGTGHQLHKALIGQSN